VAPQVTWDLHSKIVVAAGLTETLRHAGVDVDPAVLIPRPVDLPATARQADLVFATADRSTVVHVEIQQRPDRGIGRRMLGYASRIVEHPAYRDHVRDLAQVVVQVTGGRPMDTRFRVGELSNSCALVHIPSIPVAELVATSGLAPFAMVSGGSEVVPLVVRRVAEVDGSELRLAMLELAISLDPANSGVIMEQLRRDDMTDVIDELRRTDWGRGLIAEGREEGREQGRSEAQLAAIVEILMARFPTAEAEVISRTAQRLLVEAGPGAIRAAVTLDGPDSLPPS
jgi:hypothetical protein